MDVAEGAASAFEANLAAAGADPRNIDGWMTCLRSAYGKGRLQEVVDAMVQSIPKVPNPETTFFIFGRLLHLNGKVREAVRLYREILKCDPNARATHSEYLIHKQFWHGDYQDAIDEYGCWNSTFVRPVSGRYERAETEKVPDRGIRVGFVSNDFAGGHSLNTSMAAWLGRGAQDGFSYVLYSNCPSAMEIHPVFERIADDLVKVYDLSDEELNKRIRADKIDVLVDMCGHMDHNRLLTYARKPAPIIVSWIGIGIPTGVETVDYFIADDKRIGRETVEDYREKIVFLPGSGMAWNPPTEAPAVAEAPYRKNGFVTFGNLSRIVKIQRETVALWSRVLRQVPNSRMLLKDHRLVGFNRRDLIGMFEEEGIDAGRLLLKDGSDHADHLSVYGDIDLVLDTFPQQGGITTLEAAWMGVPTLSYSWCKRPTANQARWIMGEFGLSEFIAGSEDEFAQIASRLSDGMPEMARLRRELRAIVSASSICDGSGFVTSVNRAFREMWRNYCDSRPPRSFAA